MIYAIVHFKVIFAVAHLRRTRALSAPGRPTVFGLPVSKEINQRFDRDAFDTKLSFHVQP